MVISARATQIKLLIVVVVVVKVNIVVLIHGRIGRNAMILVVGSNTAVNFANVRMLACVLKTTAILIVPEFRKKRCNFVMLPFMDAVTGPLQRTSPIAICAVEVVISGDDKSACAVLSLHQTLLVLIMDHL